MKSIIHILLALLLFSGCIRETADCGPGVVTLKFRYYNTQGEDIFGERIGKVDLYIYHSSGEFVRTVSVSQQELNSFHGTTMQLDPGTYNVIAWGNIHSRTGVADTEGHSLQESYIYYSAPDNGDELYYSPGIDGAEMYTLNVPESLSAEGVMVFTDKHKTIEIYVDGLPDFGSGNGPVPQISVAGLLPGYHFDLSALAGPAKEMVQTGVLTSTPAGSLYMARFFTPEFLNDNPVVVTIETLAGEHVFSLSLAEYIAAYYPGLVLQDGGGEIIRIYVRFLNGVVTAILPDWETIPTEPELS